MSTNPYQPPSSNLVDRNAPYTPNFFWKLLFFVLFPIECSVQYQQLAHPLAQELSSNTTPWLDHYFFLLISIVYFTGLFGLAFAFRIGQRFWWLLFLPILIVVDVIQYSDLPSLLEQPDEFVMIFFYLPITVLTWISIYKYVRVFPNIYRQ